MKREKWLVTSALPYANGPIHFGHIVGAYLPADIFVRHLRLCGEDVIYICGTDEHGIAITIAAEKAGVSPMDHVDKYHKVIKNIFDSFRIEFDNFSRTTWPPHYDLSKQFFTELHEQGFISEKETEEFYCPNCKRFLADRYIAGTCPRCNFDAARGDECGNCGAWLKPSELIGPKCKVCGANPIFKKTRHYYLRLQDFSDKLKSWLATKTEWKENVKAFVNNMIVQGLEERPITRDLDWGIPVPLPGTEGKVLYVWFDAPIGYISSTREWAGKIGKPDRWKEYWLDPETHLIHFIGKDNIPFHCIVWPAMLMGQKTKYVLPENVPANEFLNLEGRPFSKGDNWYIDLEGFFEKYPRDTIRYTLCAGMPESRDTDFKWKDFQSRTNSERADIYGNLAHRTLRFIELYREGIIPACGPIVETDRNLLALCEQTVAIVGESIEKYEFRKALFEIMELARAGNKYIDDKQPWRTRKDDPADCSTTLHTAARMLAVLSYVTWPFLPDTGERLWGMLGMEGNLADVRWNDAANIDPRENQKLGKVEVLFNKIPDEIIEVEIKKLKAALPEKPAPHVNLEPLEEKMIPYDNFAALDMRAGKVLAAESVPKSKKLLKLEVDIGVEKRQLVAGIAEYYKPEDIVGKTVVVLVNLEPRKLMGIESRGMVLAASVEGNLNLLTLDGDIPPGAKVS